MTKQRVLEVQFSKKMTCDEVDHFIKGFHAVQAGFNKSLERFAIRYLQEDKQTLLIQFIDLDEDSMEHLSKGFITVVDGFNKSLEEDFPGEGPLIQIKPSTKVLQIVQPKTAP